jgi:hypothetical protein
VTAFSVNQNPLEESASPPYSLFRRLGNLTRPAAFLLAFPMGGSLHEAD